MHYVAGGIQVHYVAGGIQVYYVAGGIQVYYVAGGIQVYSVAGGIQVYYVAGIQVYFITITPATIQKLYNGAELDCELVIYILFILQTAVYVSVSESIVYRLRCAFFKSILRQDIAWFDDHAPGKLTARLTEDLDKIKEGIGEKIVSVFSNFSGVLVALVLAFFKCWALVLIIVVVAVFVLVPMVILGQLHQ